MELKVTAEEGDMWIMAQQQCALSGLSGNRVSAASPACCCAATGRRGAEQEQCWHSAVAAISAKPLLFLPFQHRV